MNKTAQKLLLSTILSAVFLVLLPTAAFASNLHLAPGGGNMGVGQTLAVQVKINTAGTPVNGVTAVISYPTDKLDIAYITPGSAFSIEAEKVVGGGTIRISRGNINGVSGDVVVATIGLRGKALGQANLAFIAGSAAPNAADSSETLNLGGSAGGQFNVVSATQSSAVPGSTAPVISEIKVDNIASGSATVSWKTDKKADSEVVYGVDKGNLILNTSSSTKVNDHSVQLTNLDFPPGTKLYFQVKSKDASNQEAVSDINSFQLKGYKVTIKITDQSGKPLSNIKTTLYSEPNESATNDQGQVTYEDVTPGAHVLLVQNGTLEKSFDLTVEDNRNLDTAQEFAFQFDAATSTTPRQPFNINSKNTIAMVILGLSLLVLIAITVYILKKRRSGGGSSGGSTTDSNPFPFFDNNSSPAGSNPVVYHPGS